VIGPSTSSGGSGDFHPMFQVGSVSFSLYGAFGNPTLSPSTMQVGGNPFQPQWNPISGFVPSQGISLVSNPFQFVRGKTSGGFQFIGFINPSFIKIWVSLRALPSNLVPFSIQVPYLLGYQSIRIC
jgi:hypothetical protein